MLNIEKIKFSGYTSELLNYILNEQFLDENLYKLFVNQFRIHSDINNGWRGEFWGKLVRSACSIYKTNKSKKLYSILKSTIVDLMSTQEKSGRVSSYSLSEEFNGWDLWGRKYVMLGMEYFYDICESDHLKRRIVNFLKKHANYIVKNIGNDKGKKSIFDTSNVYGCLNSCSIVSPFVRLFKITNDKKYLDFAKNIIDDGLCSSFDIIDAANDDNLMPFEFKEKKAYELMSCFNGVLDYYEVSKDQFYLNTVIKFFDKLIKSDYTVIGCCGTDSEFLNNSTLKQTLKEYAFSQETCVSVTLLDLAKHLFDITKASKYVDVIEKTTLNAFFGSINNEKQTMKKTRGLVWDGDNCTMPNHRSFPFDSYSPLVSSKRGYQVAGFMMLQDGESYGCCAAIGGFGFGLYSDSLISISDEVLYLNLFDSYKADVILNSKKICLKMKANSFKGNKCVIDIKSNNCSFALKIRIPQWAYNCEVYLNDEKLNLVLDDNYLSLNRLWNDDRIIIKFKRKVTSFVLNNKVSLSYGPIVLTTDERYGDIDNFNFGKKINSSKFKHAKEDLFKSNLHLVFEKDSNKYHFVDYAQAGKNYDSDNSNINVWYQIK